MALSIPVEKNNGNVNSVTTLKEFKIINKIGKTTLDILIV